MVPKHFCFLKFWARLTIQWCRDLNDPENQFHARFPRKSLNYETKENLSLKDAPSQLELISKVISVWHFGGS